MNGSVTLRPERPEDGPFLLALFAQTRSALLELLPKDRIITETILRQQFQLQTSHYRGYYPAAMFFIVELDDSPAGRLVVDRSGQEILVIDVSLLQEYQNRGIGSGLLQNLLSDAKSEGQAVRLHVERGNPALRLYYRLGFRPIQDGDVYLKMEWRADGGQSRYSEA